MKMDRYGDFLKNMAWLLFLVTFLVVSFLSWHKYTLYCVNKGFDAGVEKGIKTMQTEAVENGVGYWDTKTDGTTEFVWYKLFQREEEIE